MMHFPFFSFADYKNSPVRVLGESNRALQFLLKAVYLGLQGAGVGVGAGGGAGGCWGGGV